MGKERRRKAAGNQLLEGGEEKKPLISPWPIAYKQQHL